MWNIILDILDILIFVIIMLIALSNVLTSNGRSDTMKENQNDRRNKKNKSV
jgi:hypothetical protein